MQKAVFQTSLGWVAAAATSDGICCTTLPQLTEVQAWDHLDEELKLRSRRPGKGRHGATAGGASITGTVAPVDDAAPNGDTAAKAHLDGYRAALAAYSAGAAGRLAEIPLDLTGLPEFHLRVMQACRRIPAGETRSYAWLAQAAGSPDACRAAGNAMARNPVPLLVPCHRVLRTGGGLGGFGGGLPQKRALLAHEGWKDRQD